MILPQIQEAGIAVSLFRLFNKCYRNLKQRLSCIYQNSWIFRLTEAFREKIKVCFRYSFLGRITEISQTGPQAVNNSQAVQYLINSYKDWKDKLILYSKISATFELAKDTKGKFSSSPTKMPGAVLVAAVLVNTALALGLQKQISLWSWLIRGLFLFAGLSGLFCKADWSTLKGNSVFLRKARMN